jgi:mono/diheme cytochrome c family protein
MNLHTRSLTRTRRAATSALALAAFVLLAAAAPAAAVPDAAKLYKDQCIGCHGPDGSGNTPMGKSLKAGDLRSPAVQGQSDAQLEATVAKGKGKMQPFGKKMSPEEIAAVVKFIRTLKAGA